MRFVATFACAALSAVAAAQSAVPARNNTHGVKLPPPLTLHDSTLLFFYSNTNRPKRLLPLTPFAQNHVPHSSSTTSGIGGSLVLNTPQTFNQLRHGDFAFTSCDESDYPGEINITTVLRQAIKVNVSAIIFYSPHTAFCAPIDTAGYNGYKALYSTETAADGMLLLKLLNNGTLKKQQTETIYTYGAFARYVNSQQYGQIGAGSTAVAMIILYSITGVITALFLIIIVTGAIRAHRHPERYGPRNVLGRPRQSRAKGIARAMLDTLPIVKFGEKEPDAPKDTEIGSSIGLEDRSPDLAYSTTATHDEAQASTGVSESHPDGGIAAAAGPTPTPDAASAAEKHSHADEAQGCSICTDDFEIGQDIRVLPCNHKFHPACVDPWLLEVSGTCPLCRVDLQPSAPATGEGGDASDELPPPLDPAAAADEAHAAAASRRRDTIRSFLGPRFNRRGLQGASGEERLEMLRRWREASRAQSTGPSASGNTTAATTDAATTDEENTRARRLSRFSRIIRPRRDGNAATS